MHKSESLKAFPGCYGMIKAEGERNVLKLGSYRLGDKYSEIVSSGMRELKELDEYVFSRNRLTDRGFGQLLATINSDVVRLDFSNNQIHSVDSHLMKILSSKESRLEHLNLENNKLGDAAMASLVLALGANRTVRYLNLNRNFLGNGENIAMIIDKGRAIEQLYLNWNKLNGQGAKLIFSKLEKNKSIVVLDYSSNMLGQCPGMGECIGAFLRQNSKLLHLDLSFNNFSLAECEQVSESLKSNHSLYGFHFSGNYGYVNHEGFLVLDDHKQANTYDTVRVTRMNGFEVCFRRPYASNDWTLQKDVCWICEGWGEWALAEPAPQAQEFMVHFSFNAAQGRREVVKDGKARILAMLPPTAVQLFYTVDGAPGVFSSLETQPLRTDSSILCPRLSGVSSVNIVTVAPKRLVTEENSQIEVKTCCLPRATHKLCVKRKSWAYKDSVWAREWKNEDEVHILAYVGTDQKMLREGLVAFEDPQPDKNSGGPGEVEGPPAGALQKHKGDLQALCGLEPVRRYGWVYRRCVGDFAEPVHGVLQPGQAGLQGAALQDRGPDVHHDELHVGGRLEGQPPGPRERLRTLPVHGGAGAAGRREVPQERGVRGHVGEHQLPPAGTPEAPVPPLPQREVAPDSLLHRAERRPPQEVPAALQGALPEELEAQGQARRQALHVPGRV